MSDWRDIEIKTLAGEIMTLHAFDGRALLVVNVASKCGFTPQYRSLETLYRTYKHRGFVVLGFPCNQFGHQEPGDEESIRNFCSESYDVTFPMFAKVDVNGPGAHPLYRHLKKAAPGILGSEGIKWNFTKFLVHPLGNVVARYAPHHRPEDLSRDLAAVLPQQRNL